MSAFKELKKVSGNKDTKKKTSGVAIEDFSMEDLCNKFIQASKNFKNAKAALDNYRAELIEFMIPKHAEEIRNHTNEKTFRLNDKVMCIFTDRFRALPEEYLETVQQILSGKNVPMDRLFKEKVNLKIKKSVATNEDLMAELIEKMEGVDLLARYFDIDVTTNPVEKFFEAVSNANVYNELEDLIRALAYEPTVKVS